MNVAKHDDLQRMVGYQVKKFNACRKCLKCESLCRFGAITIIGEEYRISDNKCKRCKMCVTRQNTSMEDALMDKYLRQGVIMRFRAHETFFIRTGWLYKGKKNVIKDSNCFYG
jgi:MinD superfamily P-loop ATPase